MSKGWGRPQIIRKSWLTVRSPKGKGVLKVMDFWKIKLLTSHRFHLGTGMFRDLGSASSSWTRIQSRALGPEESNLKKEMETNFILCCLD